MVKTSSIKEPYFSHNCSMQGKKEIKKLIRDLGYEGYGIFWTIWEFMFRNELKIGEEDLILGEKYTDKVKKILSDYELFRTENDYYISDELLDIIEIQEEEAAKKSKAANTRWRLSELKKLYKEIFNTTASPVLKNDEITIYLKYYETVENFQEILPDILFTLKDLKFANNPNFNPSINWLLTENHLPKLLNGEYGRIKSYSDFKQKKAKAREIEKAEQAAEQESNKKFEELEKRIAAISSKADAIKLLSENCNDPNILTPTLKELKNRFEITNSEIYEWRASHEQID